VLLAVVNKENILLKVNLVSKLSWGKVVERGSLLTLGNIFGLGEAKVLLLWAGLWVWDHLGPVDNHILGQLTNFVNVFANSINCLLLDLPVGKVFIRRFTVQLKKKVFKRD
jgi:hypothetical protein